MSKTNMIVLLIFGGGLAEPAKHIILRTAERLSKIYKKVYIGRYSFESLYTPEFILEYTEQLANEAEGKRGSFFGTCRGIDLSDPIRFNRAIYCLKQYGINTIVVQGGDGSSRQVAETYEKFNEHGINIIFPIPMTIDGIEGGESAGTREAVRLSVRDIEDMASTSLNTRDIEAFGVFVARLQGRNRDDIMAKALLYFDIKGKIADFSLSDVLIKAIPANYSINYEALIKDVNASYKRTLILLSEGSSITMQDLQRDIKRKVRTFEIGHRSQSNGLMTKEDEIYYDKWVDKICEFIRDDPLGNYSLAKLSDLDDGVYKRTINYYAVLNPRENQKATLPSKLEALLQEYM